jgi:hypothetical protein
MTRKHTQTDTPALKSAFLEALAECGVIRTAANKAGIDRKSVYNWKANDPVFAELFDVAIEDANDAIRQEIRRRAVEGWLEPVYQQGQKVGTIRKYSDGLLRFLATSRMPEFRERVDVTTAGQPISYAAIISDPISADLAAQLAERATVLPATPGEHASGTGENSEP